MTYLWRIFIVFAPLLYLTMIAAGFVVVIAIWRWMKAHERIAASMERMADVAERIEKRQV